MWRGVLRVRHTLYIDRVNNYNVIITWLLELINNVKNFENRWNNFWTTLYMRMIGSVGIDKQEINKRLINWWVLFCFKQTKCSDDESGVHSAAEIQIFDPATQLRSPTRAVAAADTVADGCHVTINKRYSLPIRTRSSMSSPAHSKGAFAVWFMHYALRSMMVRRALA